jgi:TonB-dependent receptor
MSVTLGGSDLVAGHRFGYIASGTYSLTSEARLRQTRSLGRVGSTPEEFIAYNGFQGTSAGTSALMGGILNLSTLVGSHTQLKLNNTYTRTADNDARIERGIFEEIALPVQIQLMDYVERSVWSSQFVAERETDANKLKFSLTGSGVNRSEPDRSEFVQEVRTNNGAESLLWLNSRAESAVRTFSELGEKSLESGLDFQRRLGGDGSTRSVKFGVLGRGVDRDTDSRSYTIFATTMTDADRALSPEVLFGGRFTAPDSQVMVLKPLSSGGSYDANDYLGAGYGMFDGYIAENWRLTTGARFEHSFLRVRAVSTLGDDRKITKTFDDVLPSVALTYTPSSRVNVRFSATRTLARPEYREVAPLLYRDVIAATSAIGNPDLVRTLIDNADVRWEFYPERGELLSVGLFGKRFQNPIERVAIASSAANELETFINAKGGTDLGIEIEARRNLRLIADALAPFTAFANATVMHSRIDLTGNQTATNKERAMVGQAPYIVNAGVTWTMFGNEATNATFLFNRIGERISAAGEFPNPDVIESARSTMDVSLRFPLLRGMSGRLDAKNLLDQSVTRRQGPVVREQYWTGRVFQLGLTWQ